MDQGGWRSILRAARVRIRPFGQCRHTFATLLLADSEIDPRYIADQMGHATLNMLFAHYARWMPGRAPRPKHDAIARALGASAPVRARRVK